MRLSNARAALLRVKILRGACPERLVYPSSPSFARYHIPVAMHGLDPPMPAVEAQDVVRIRLLQAGDGIRCFGFGFDNVPGPDVPALTPDAGNGANRGPCGAHVFAGRIGGQQGDATQVNPPMPCPDPVRGGSCHSARGKNRLPKGRFNLLPKVFPVILHRKKAVTAFFHDPGRDGFPAGNCISGNDHPPRVNRFRQTQRIGNFPPLAA